MRYAEEKRGVRERKRGEGERERITNVNIDETT